MSVIDAAPAAWGRVTLGDLTAETRPICYGVLKPGPHVPNGVPLVRIQDLRNGTVDAAGLHYISDELDAEFARSRLEGGEVLISIQGTIGRVAICPPALAGANISRTIAVIKPDTRLRPRFLAYFLRLLGEASAFPTQGATRASLNIGALRELAVPVPPLVEQDAVVESLDRLLGLSSTGVGSFQRALGAVDPYRSTTLRAIFSGDLNTLASPIRAELRRAARRPLRDLASIKYGFTAKATEEPVGPRMLRITDIQGGRVKWTTVPFCAISNEDRREYLLRPGDIVFARMGFTTGKSYLIGADVPEAVYASYLIRVRASAEVKPEFLALFFQSSEYWAYVFSKRQGIDRPTVNGKVLAALPAPVPSHAAQDAAIAEAKRHLEAVAQLRERLSEQIAEGRRAQFSLLYQAFTGVLTRALPEREDVEQTKRAVPVGS